MSLPTLNNIIVATVTYSNRFELLEQVIKNQISNGVDTIVVIDNGCPYDVEEKLKCYKDKIKIIVDKIKENTGSAEGFYHAIKLAGKVNNKEYILLLDDDNVLSDKSIDKLILSYKMFNDESYCFLCLRDDRKEFVDAINTGDWNNASENSFQSFSLTRSLISFSKKRKKLSNFPFVPVDYAPYGGFFFHKKWLEKIGYPDLSYKLYSDDHDFTYRVTKNGGEILLTSLSRVIDIEDSWYISDSKCHRFFLKDVNKDRLYMSILNRVKFERKYLISSRIKYTFNGITYLVINYLLSLKYNIYSYRNVPVIIKAIIDGFKSK